MAEINNAGDPLPPVCVSIVQHKSSYTGAESYVAGLLEIKDQSWVPQRKSRSMQVAYFP